MSLAIKSSPAPLERDVDGVVRVGGTRVALEVVVGAFTDGATAEEISSQYPSLSLADTYAVIAYYLRHRTEIDEYVAARASRAAAVKAETESRFDPAGVRKRLLARKSA
ncbi:MAG: DUF433 domain-containing protein [Deltaproteobacteria bacterium]|nr:DUF433 domain-containing protein [Deltaproteobacteria bacterium]